MHTPLSYINCDLLDISFCNKYDSWYNLRYVLYLFFTPETRAAQLKTSEDQNQIYWGPNGPHFSWKGCIFSLWKCSLFGALSAFNVTLVKEHQQN